MVKDTCRWHRWIAVAAALVASACGSAGQERVDEEVDPGGSLVSEDGTIAFTHAARLDWADLPSSEADVYAIDVDGSGRTRLTDSPGLDGFPAWSPDGERIAFVSARDGGDFEIYVMDADGSNQRRLTRTRDDEFYLAWSPDGGRIAYSHDPRYDPSIWAMDADGSDRERLADGLFPSWSPDGERIAFTEYMAFGPYTGPLTVINVPILHTLCCGSAPC